MASVVKEEPRLHAIPPQLQRLLKSCLEKDPKYRLRDIGDAWKLLDEVAESEPASPAERRRRWLWPCVASLALLAAFSLAVADRLRTPPKPGMAVFTIQPPAGQVTPSARVSPDGKQVALATIPQGGGNPRLLIRSLENLALRPVPGTENIGIPTQYSWSPDSRKIVFAEREQIKTVDVAATGSVQSVCRADRAQLSDWGANGMVLFSAVDPSGKLRVFQVPATGGDPQAVIPLDDARKESSQTGAQFLPGGKRLLYYSQGEMNQGTYVVSLDGKFRKLVKNGSADTYLRHPRTGQSYLLSCESFTGCVIQQFDAGAARLIGDPVPVAQLPTLGVRIAAAPAGLVYLVRPGGSRSKLAWYSRDGKELEMVSEAETIFSHELSPDGRQVAWELLTEPNGYGDIWVKDLVRGSKLRLTSDSGWEYTQRFWPDGSKIAFMWFRDQPRRFHIAVKPANGSGAEDLVLEAKTQLYLDDVSPDGAFLLYQQIGPPSALWVLPMADRRPVLFRSSQSYDPEGRFSPDGRWIAYTSSDSGRNEIHVQDFVAESGAAHPTRGALTVVSTDGGRLPRWSRDGKELFYLAPDNTLMVVPVKTSPNSPPAGPRSCSACRGPRAGTAFPMRWPRTRGGF